MLPRQAVEGPGLLGCGPRPSLSASVGGLPPGQPGRQIGTRLVEVAAVVEPSQFPQAVVVGLARDVVEGVAREVDMAALPGGLGKNLPDRLPESVVVVLTMNSTPCRRRSRSRTRKSFQLPRLSRLASSTLRMWRRPSSRCRWRSHGLGADHAVFPVSGTAHRSGSTISAPSSPAGGAPLGRRKTWRLRADAGAGGRSPRPVTRDRLAADPAAHGGAGSRPESVLPARRLGGAGPHGEIHRKKHDKDIKMSTLFTPSSYAVWILDPWLSTLRRGNDPASNAGAVHRSGGAGQ